MRVEREVVMTPIGSIFSNQRPHLQVLFAAVVLIFAVALMHTIDGHWYDAVLSFMTAAGVGVLYSARVAPALRAGVTLREAGFLAVFGWYGLVAIFVVLNLLTVVA